MEEGNYTDIKIGRDVNGNVVSGQVHGNVTINNFESNQNVFETATEIRQIIENLETNYSTGSTSGKMALASEAINRIENNPRLRQRALSAIKVGGTQALSQALNHPVASFIIAALEDWQKSGRT